MRQITIEPWAADWASNYKAEAAVLRSVFGAQLLDIHHIGSTSVPAIGWAKPIIDILLIVRDIGAVPYHYDSLVEAGYEPRGENGIVGREYFTKGRDHRTHHLHVYEQSHPQVSDHLLFRDYLARHPEQALQYGELKRQLTNDYQYDPFGYQQAKADHCRDIVRRAHQWHDQNDE